MSKKKKNNQGNAPEMEEKITPEADVTEEEQAEETEFEEAEACEAASEETDEAEGPEDESKPEKPAKKERKLKWAMKDDLEEKLRDVNDRYARLFAEFDNFRKRTDKEKTQRYDFGVRDIVEKILPVIDNFERGLAAVPEDKADDSFVTGMQMTYKLLMKTLEDAGVKPIEAVGQEFNPDFHNAVMHVDDPEVGDNIIVEEFQKGYIYKDHVVRYSMVKVAN